jgi:hypothetical protein
MTGNEVISRAKAKVSRDTGVDWQAVFQEAWDEVMGEPGWKFTRQELSYIHPANQFEKTFDEDSLQLSLDQIITLRYIPQTVILGGGGMPLTDDYNELPFTALGTFRKLYPYTNLTGTPMTYTQLHPNDGLTGMQIGIYFMPVDDILVWIDGEFTPRYDIVSGADLQIPFIPKKFHRILIYGAAAIAASETGQDATFKQNRGLFNLTLQQLKAFDRANPNFDWRKKSILDSADDRRKGPYFPSNFPRGFGR